MSKQLQVPVRPVALFYDAECGFCSNTIARLQRLLARRGVRSEPIQTSILRKGLNATNQQLLYAMHVLMSDGSHVAGPSAYRELLKLFWWGRPLYLLTVLPGFAGIFDRATRKIAANRHRL